MKNKQKYKWVRTPDFNNLPKNIDYNDYWKFRGWETKKNLKNRELLALDMIDAGKKVIDFGCGNSLLPVKLKEKGVNMFISDVSNDVLEGYKKYKIPGYTIDLDNLDVGDLPKDFDFIILFEVLEHLKYPERVIEKLSEHTKEFLVTVPNSAAYYYRLSLLFKGRFFTQWVYHPSEHLRYWSHIDFMDWLSAIGLEVVESRASDGMQSKGLTPWLPNLWKNLFADRVLYRCRVKK